MRGFIIAGTQSGAGKTTISIGLMAALKRRGFIVQPFKAGPDFIDPGYHKVVCGRSSYNLDTWIMGIEAVNSTFARVTEGTDIAIIEGVMGLFDGRDGMNEEGSTAHIAKSLGLPVILIIDARSMARSAGALIYGFENFDPEVKMTGVIFNRVGSKRHSEILRDSIKGRSKIEILGYIPRDEGITIPERHLGLVTASEFRVQSLDFRVFLEKLTNLIEENIDLDKLLSLSSILKRPSTLPLQTQDSKLKTKIAVAFDNAFSFYYQENLDILEELGAELVFFSPLKDKKLPEDIKGIYIGGGYPELYAKTLEANTEMREEIRTLTERGLPVYVECGGLMYLGEELVDKDGKSFEMAGVFPWKSRMLKNRKSLGYAEIEAGPDCPFLKDRERIRGHEYHYSEIEEPPEGIKRVYKSIVHGPQSTVKEGYLYKNVLASYIHLHFTSNPEFARGFMGVCQHYRSEEGYGVTG